MNDFSIKNYSKLNLSLLWVPLSALFLICLFLYWHNAWGAERYIEIQKDSFFYINYNLSFYADLQYNLTQLGNALILFSFLSLFVIYAPVIWESLASGSVISLFFCDILKKLFAVPRPAAVFENNTFLIIGKKVCASNSLPSGHSITIFTTIAVVMFAFMPYKIKYRILWCGSLLIFGAAIVITRVGVGAHYPIDVLAGAAIGFISGLLGIFLNRRFNAWKWIRYKRYYPFFIVSFLLCCCCLIYKIKDENLTIFYLSLISLIISLYEITSAYIKK